jgi:hypothetical protein
MSSINQILNSALMETVEKPVVTTEGLESQPMSDLAKTQSNTDEDKEKTGKPSAAPSPGSIDWATAGKYGGAGLAALGAGLGAVALAKKLRAKKTAMTAVKAKK